MLADEIEEAYDYWNDRDFVAELNQRSSDYKSGKVKGISWEEAKTQIMSSEKRIKK
jgi:putative addiction module component (TIGR02574 family)